MFFSLFFFNTANSVSVFKNCLFFFFVTETTFRFINFLFGPLNSLPRQDRSQIRDLWILEEGLYLSKSGICIPFDTTEEIHTLSISATSMWQTALLFKTITPSRGWLCFLFLLTWGLVFWLLWPMERMHKLGRGYQCCKLPPLFPWPTEGNIPDKPFHHFGAKVKMRGTRDPRWSTVVS